MSAPPEETPALDSAQVGKSRTERALHVPAVPSCLASSKHIISSSQCMTALVGPHHQLQPVDLRAHIAGLCRSPRAATSNRLEQVKRRPPLGRGPPRHSAAASQPAKTRRDFGGLSEERSSQGLLGQVGEGGSRVELRSAPAGRIHRTCPLGSLDDVRAYRGWSVR